MRPPPPTLRKPQRKTASPPRARRANTATGRGPPPLRDEGLAAPERAEGAEVLLEGRGEDERRRDGPARAEDAGDRAAPAFVPAGDKPREGGLRRGGEGARRHAH